MSSLATHSNPNGSSQAAHCITDQFYSVEFAIDHPHPLYQFKIWGIESDSMFVVVKEDSAILSKLKVGCVYNMKYYSTDTHCPTKQMDTCIKDISSDKYGRFQGHHKIKLFPVNEHSYETLN